MNFKRSNEILYSKPPLEMFLGEYNMLLASILVENIDNLAYIASSVINRMEAQTHLYEKIEKYIQIQDLLAKEKDLGIIVAEEDDLIYGVLKREYKSRVKKEDKKDEKLFLLIRNRLKKINILRFSVRIVLVFWQTLKRILVTQKMRLTKKEYKSIIRTYFDFRCKDANGRLREEYFGSFADDLAKKESLLVVYKLLHPKDIWRFLRLLKQKSNFDSCLIESFLNPFLLVKALLQFSFNKIRLKKEYYYRNREITTLLREIIDRDFYSLRGIDVFIEYEIAKKILRFKPERLYLPYENQTWEKVYPLVKKEIDAKETRIIGFQHTSLSYKLIMHFPTKIEKDLPLFPDKILTVGKIYQRLFKEKAYYPCEIVKGAALRHSKYVTNGNFNIKLPHKKLQKKIAYAFSYDLSKYRNILMVLLDVFKDSKINLYLKMHPDYNENDVLKSLQINLPENIILAQRIPWSTLYDSVDCILYDDNSIGVEGMINGVKTYMLDISEPIYEVGRMYYFNEWETSIDVDGLEKIKKEIENNTFNPWYNLEKIKEYINLYFSAYSKEKYFEAYL